MNDVVMSELGQTRRFPDVRRMSGLPPSSDVSGAGRDFAFGPEAEVTRAVYFGCDFHSGNPARRNPSLYRATSSARR